MDTSKIIRGVVSNGRYTVTAPIVKEDYGLYLQIEGVELPSTYEVDFSNSEHNGTSVTMIGNSDGVLIPRQFIDSGKDVFAFLYHVGADYGRTVYKFRIPNKVRPDRTEETPTPEEQSTIDQLISALNSAVEQTGEDVESASQSAQSAESAKTAAESARDTAGEYANDAESSAASASTSASQASTSATASAQSASQSAQIKADVEDLVDDAQGYANASAQSASQASASEQGCARAVLDAASAAAIARARAEEASGYAQTASAKAQDASGYAQTASQKATEASQSASQALSYKTDAESAKTASQTAQGLAESAKDSAVSAKTDAESAKADAESARDEAQQAVASISGALAEKAPIITDTASGSIASFPDGADGLPLKSLVVDINPVQDLSHGDPSPENICPISGWTSVDVEQSGKNLFDFEGFLNRDNITYEKSGDSFTFSPRQSMYTNPWRFAKKDSVVSISVQSIANITSRGIKLRFLNDSGTTVFSTTDSVLSARNIVASQVRLDWSTLGRVTITAPQIEFGTENTSYEPYNGQSITINLGQTVYGGKLDVLSGELVIDRAMVDLGTLTPYKTPANVFVWHVLTPTNGTILCSNYTTAQSGLVPSSIPDKTVCTTNAVGTYYPVALKDSSYYNATVEEMKTAMSGVQLVYELAEPIEIQLTPNQVNSLLGVNNIWADSGDTEAEYRVDTKLYIERLTAPDSADMVADANIVSGQYFMVGNSLYKATANIANGGQIIVGTNATRVSLAQALNEINA